MVGGEACERSECRDTRAQLEAAQMRTVQLQAEVVALEGELAEAMKLIELQKADLDRYEKAIQDARPNQPERTPVEQLQLAWKRILGFEAEAANDDGTEAEPTSGGLEGMPAPGEGRADGDRKRRHRHGRRPAPDFNHLPQKEIVIDPAEVREAGGEGFRCVGEETARRVAFQPSSYICLITRRRKWVRVDDPLELVGLPEQSLPPVLIGELPSSLWPRFMADASAVANIIITKYGDIVPLNRQETISRRHGFPLSRATQCGWLSQAHQVLYRIVGAMLVDARQSAHCICTDATTAPVQAVGACIKRNVFVLLADDDHVIFQPTRAHTSAEVLKLFEGFTGVVLADAAKVFDTLFRDHGMTESGCWSHMRRYAWKAVETESERAYEVLALISQLFAIERECADDTPEERLATRKARAGPILDALDRWIARQRDHVDPRGRLRAAITYYDNQREALRYFLRDGRVSIHNNASERELRNLVLGRDAWKYFANETGVRWYCVFRSLIASCALHDINPQTYLEQVLRLAPHWPITRMLELAPKNWKRTLELLDDTQRLIVTAPWDLDPATLAVQAGCDDDTTADEDAA